MKKVEFWPNCVQRLRLQFHAAHNFWFKPELWHSDTLSYPTPYPVTLCAILFYYTLSCPVPLYLVLSCVVLSCLFCVMFCILCYPLLFYLVWVWSMLSCFVPLHPILSWPSSSLRCYFVLYILSCFILSYLRAVLSCSVFIYPAQFCSVPLYPLSCFVVTYLNLLRSPLPLYYVLFSILFYYIQACPLLLYSFPYYSFYPIISYSVLCYAVLFNHILFCPILFLLSRLVLPWLILICSIPCNPVLRHDKLVKAPRDY